MRDILDDEGRAWTVLVGRESYGVQVLLFAAEGGGEVRKATLLADTRIDAEAELARYSDQNLRDRLAESSPWGEEFRP